MGTLQRMLKNHRRKQDHMAGKEEKGKRKEGRRGEEGEATEGGTLERKNKEEDGTPERDLRQFGVLLETPLLASKECNKQCPQCQYCIPNLYKKGEGDTPR